MQENTENVEARIIALYEAGDHSKSAICEELGIGKKKLYRVLREAGLIEPEGTNPHPAPVEELEDEESADEEPGDPEEEENEEFEEEEFGDAPAPVVVGSPTKLLLGAAAGLFGGYMLWGRRDIKESPDPTDPEYRWHTYERGRSFARRLLAKIGR